MVAYVQAKHFFVNSNFHFIADYVHNVTTGRAIYITIRPLAQILVGISPLRAWFVLWVRENLTLLELDFMFTIEFTIQQWIEFSRD